jgi:hypothetical protein
MNVGIVIIYISMVAVLMYGWVQNIIALLGASYAVITGKLVVGAIGVFVAPIGSIMGLFVW